MAITRKASEPQKEDSLILDFNNGDLEILKQATGRLGFQDEESLLRYTLAVILKSVTCTMTMTGESATRAIRMTGTDGKSISLC